MGCSFFGLNELKSKPRNVYEMMRLTFLPKGFSKKKEHSYPMPIAIAKQGRLNTLWGLRRNCYAHTTIHQLQNC